MKHPAHIYAKAFNEAMRQVPEGKHREVITRFIRLLERNGDITRIREITEAIERYEVVQKGGKWVLLEYARRIAKNHEKIVANQFSSKDRVETRENPSLVAGTRITIDNETQLDYSFAAAIKKIFI